MANEQQYRLRVRYGKDGRLAYLGHLEVLHTIDSSIRRSRLPFSVGNGFARRMRVQFSQALPVGASSKAEYYDLVLTEPIEPEVALERLRASTPSALAPTKAAYVERRAPALEAWLTRSDWHAELEGTGITAEALDAAIAAVAETGAIHYMRGEKPKVADLTRTLVSWPCAQSGDVVELSLQTRSSNEGALRPAILIDAAFSAAPLAGAQLAALRVTREMQAHEEGARLVNPFDENLVISLT